MQAFTRFNGQYEEACQRLHALQPDAELFVKIPKGAQDVPITE